MVRGRRTVVSALVIGLTLSGIGIVSVHPADAAPGESSVPIDNPDLPIGCGLDVNVVLDESGSVKNFKRDVQTAFRAFTAALNNTGSRMAVSEFSTVARLPLAGAARDDYTVITDETIDSTFEPYIDDDYEPNGSTNWEDGMRVSRYMLPRPSQTLPHLVVFITDGNPNKVIREDRVTYDPGNSSTSANEYENKVPLADNEVQDANENTSTDRAAANANGIKAMGSHILALAVGDGLSSPSSLDRLKKISGPDVYDGQGTFDISTTDVYREDDFSQLGEALEEAAFQLCAPSVTVRKLVDYTPDNGPQDAVAGAGFELTGVAAPTPSSWVLPGDATGDTAVTTTDGNGFATFQWSYDTPTGSRLTVTEEDPSGVEPGLVFDPSATSCSYRTPDIGDTPLPTTPVERGFSADIPSDAIVTCTILNEIPPSPSISLKKFTNQADADEAPGPSIPVGDQVEWAYVLTNTGNTTLNDIEVSDDQGVTVTCPVDTLAPAAETICRATGTAVAGQYENVGTVTAADTYGTDVTDSDPSHYFGASPGIGLEKRVNGERADFPFGPLIPVGGPVVWTYTVTNEGNTPLVDIVVTDDHEGAVTCPQDALLAGERMTCTLPEPSLRTAVEGQYENLATVEARDATGIEVSASDPSHYFGVVQGIQVIKATNREDANDPTGPTVPVGSPVQWTYYITNTGNVPVYGWELTDSDANVVPACPDVQPLRAGQSVICLAQGTAIEGQYSNTAHVEGEAQFGMVEDDDPSHYFGASSSIDLEKATNTVDADLPPGPFVPVGDPVTWDYVVTNTGNMPLSQLVLEDSVEGTVGSCPATEIAPGDSVTCTLTSTAAEGLYTNTARVSAVDSLGAEVADVDPSHYFGKISDIDVEKATNGMDADQEPGPFIEVGGEVTWSYTVTNRGNVPLTNIQVADDLEGVVECPQTTLAASATMTCTEKTGVAVAGQYANMVTATGTAPGQEQISDEDPSHYFGYTSAVSVTKYTNGEDANDPTGPAAPVGSTVTWTYVVTNTGTIPIMEYTVTDSDPDVDVTCPNLTPLPPGQSVTCSATGTAVAGQYANTATVDAVDMLEQPLTGSDPSHYFGVTPEVTIVKSTNGEDANQAPGPLLPVGSTVTWTYLVTNTGDAPLTQVAVSDDQGVAITCPETTLAVGESFTCSATGTAVAGQYENVGTVTAVFEPPAGEGDPPFEPVQVTDSDPSHYFGAAPAVDIEKATNGEDADVAPGPTVPTGSTVTWTYVVTNTGEAPLTQVAVTDDQEGVIDCPETTLAVGASFTCSATGTAVAGQYENLGTVTAVFAPPAGDDPPFEPVPVTDTDPSHYFGAAPAVDIEKATNGQDADEAPGPLVPVGSTVTWTYVVTNTGEAPLTQVAVTDDQVGVIDCPATTLAVGESFTCTATGTAVAGQYENVGTVTAVFAPPAGDDPPFEPVRVSDEDPSHYLGVVPAVDIEKATNGQDADTGTGPLVPVGSTVTWTYVVTNTGEAPLTRVAVTDDQVGPIICPSSLAVGASFTCTATGTAEAGQYENVGTVTALFAPPAGDDPPFEPVRVSDEDPSHYLGVVPAVDIEKATNGQDADEAPGPLVPVGSTVTWTYVVTNTGEAPLTQVAVTDDQDVEVTCPQSTLAVGESFTCTATGTAVAGQYENVGTVTALFAPPAGDDPPFEPVQVTDSDPSHYFGAAPAVDIEKATNGEDADEAPGPLVPVGSTVTWTYVVTNTGEAPLTQVAVTDDQDVEVTCPQSTLAVGESFTCTATGTAVAGQYANVGTVTAVFAPPAGDDPPFEPVRVSDEDPSHYLGVVPAVDIEKATNGQDADEAPGPLVPVGSTVTWTYVVTNTGDAPLTRVAVTDDQVGPITCPSSLAVGASFTCTATGTAEAGQYENVGTVTALFEPPAGDDPPFEPVRVSDEDPSHYLGVVPAVDIEKATNGEDADEAPGPLVPVGSTVTWTYVVANTGEAPLTQVAVTDDQDVEVTCPQSTLAVGESFACTATGTAVAGQYENVGTVTALFEPPAGSGDDPPFEPVPVTDTDPSHYFGAAPAVDIEKATNGQDADEAPGPLVPVGSTVTWTYVVTNTGEAPLTQVAVTDDQVGVIDCPATTLAVGESFTCTATGTAVAGQYANVGTVTALFAPPAGDDPPFEPVQVSDSDPSHYFGAAPAVDIEKATNGQDADEAPGPLVPVGSTVTWTYVVTNTGEAPLTQVAVIDDQDVEVTCPQSTLAVGASFTCTATGTAVAGQYENLGTVTALFEPPAGDDPPFEPVQVSDSDPSHYLGVVPAVDIEKATNGEDADEAPGPLVPVGSTVTWTYVVTNTGEAPLTQVAVTDDQDVEVTCPQSTLAVGESFTCTATGTAVAGQYENVGTVTAVFAPPAGSGDDPPFEPVPVSDSDPSHYFGAAPAVDIEKATNGQDADEAPGPTVPTGSTVTWTYVVTNTGNSPLTQVAVTDDKLGAITCPKTTLAAGEQFTCTATGTAQTGQYANLGTVTAVLEPPASSAATAVRALAFEAITVTDSDPSHYVGSAPTVPTPEPSEPTSPTEPAAPDVDDSDLAGTGGGGAIGVLLAGSVLLLIGAGLMYWTRRRNA